MLCLLLGARPKTRSVPRAFSARHLSGLATEACLSDRAHHSTRSSGGPVSGNRVFVCSSFRCPRRRQTTGRPHSSGISRWQARSGRCRRYETTSAICRYLRNCPKSAGNSVRQVRGFCVSLRASTNITARHALASASELSACRKSSLVPGNPPSVLENAGVTQFVQVPGGFTQGSGARILNIQGLPSATPLICYEAIFPVEIGDAQSGASRRREIPAIGSSRRPPQVTDIGGEIWADLASTLSHVGPTVYRGDFSSQFVATSPSPRDAATPYAGTNHAAEAAA